MKKQTNIKKNYKSYKFKKTMKRNKKYKRTHMKKFGGHINFPIYENVSQLDDVCPKLSVLNKELTESAKIILNKQTKSNNNNMNKIQKPQLSKEVIDYIKLKKAIDTQSEPKKLEKLLEQQKTYTEQQILQYTEKYQEYIDYEKNIKNLKKKNSSNNLNIDSINLKSTLTLYDFQNILNTNCNGLYINKDEHIILIDNNNNHVHANYNDLLSNETYVHVFKITPIYQVEYLGKEKKEKYPLYTFDSLYYSNNNHKKIKDIYWLNTLKYLKENNTPKILFDISNNFELPIYTKIIKQFVIQTPQSIIINDSNNLIKNITFINKMEEFIKLININYDNYGKSIIESATNNKNNKNNTNNTKISNIEKYKILKEYISTKVDIEQILKKTFTQNSIELKKFNTNNVIYLKKFKLFLLEGKSPLILDINFLLFLYKELYNGKSVYDISIFKNFLYTCILLHKSGFYDSIESLNNIKNAYIYITLSTAFSTINDETSLKKKYKMFILESDIEQLLVFFDEINNFIIELNDARNEFEHHKIKIFNPIIKNLILSCYIFYLNKSYDKIRPVSVKSHIDKYLKGPKIIINNNISVFSKLNFRLLNETTVSVDINNKLLSFTNCGERTLFTFFKYLLFDVENNYITNANIQILNSIYPDNILKKIFNDDLLRFTNDEDQTTYLLGKQNDFAQLLTNWSKSENKIMFSRVDRCEIKPSLENSIKMIFFLLTNNNKKYDNIPYENDDLINLIKEFKKKGDIYKSTKLIIDNYLKFEFDSSHADVSFVNNVGPNYFETIIDPLIAPIVKEIRFGKSFNFPINSDMMPYIEELELGENFTQPLLGTFEKLKKIKFRNYRYNHNIDSSIIPNIETLIFSGYLGKITGIFEKLKIVRFANNIPKYIDLSIMPNIEELQLPDYFNKPLTNVFNKLKIIMFGRDFNKDIDSNVIPNIENIDFEDESEFNSKLIGVFDKLKKITFGIFFNQTIDLNTMPNIEEISIPKSSENIENILSNLTEKDKNKIKIIFS